MKRVIPTCLTFILFLSMFVVFCPIEVAKGETLHVGSGQTYSNIQDAIDAANESDTIYVHSGIYSENLVIQKTITLTGAGSGSVTVSGSGDHTIKVHNNSVKISGFKIQNTGGSYYCVFLSSVTGCEISNNVVKNGGNGIYLGSSNSNTIKNNTVESNNIGIYLFNSDSNTIKSNNIQNNNANGIWLTSTCTGNTIYLNDFSGNPDSNAKDYGSNNWDDGSQGNYWDDYNDYDSNPEDGIGDNPYIIEGGGGNQDNYPLGDFLSLNQQPVAYIDSISPNPATHGDTVYFNGHGSDDDGSVVLWEWRANGVVLSNDSEDYSTSSLSPGTYTISYRVRDDDDNWSPTVEKTLVINAQNQKPVAYILDPIQPITKQYGESIRFLGQGSDDGQIMEYSWRSSIDGYLSDTSQFTINNLTVGQHTIYFKVRDDYGEWSSEVSIAVTIESDPSNNPPIADAGGPYSGYVNQSITFDGSSSYDPDDGDSITSYQWDFGDGSTGEGVTTQHIYTSEGSYTVELTVKDSNGEQTKITTSVSVQVESQNGNGGEDGDKDNGIPGFELVFVIIAIAFILFIKRKKRK